ncbi:MAG TPA: OmpA family protein [Candidatus Latescibacteria bacterium]|jgi:peptidoglycan-associated lipoprotein|nr:OmpA family protein [Kiritimatiellia bacterium]HOM57588.1 OmpA family protein [Candidatus Latescibacterota bacterium]HOR97657.1 OmpA family protein [Kiritimatiellia bacterium]HPC49730.1 OmpA family protein [Kiritimatiellia bacterium]HPW75283.1 OmpA family protein [Kiritimatiellia bacterium]
MHIRSIVAVNVVLMGLLLFTDTGCRLPWQKGKGKGGSAGLGDPTLLENADLAQVTDEFGHTLSGARFEDTLQPVQGVTFAPVYFAFDSYALPPTEISKIDQVGQHLHQNAGHVLVVEGHCDERGSNEYNLSLGENRAQALRAHLVNQGISADRIQTRSYGEEKPAVAGSGEEVWRLNRRGEFALFQK